MEHFNLEINVFTICFLLLMLLGLQMQISKVNGKLDVLLDRNKRDG